MEQFKVFRAIGLSLKAWFANFIPITLLAAVLWSPIFYWVATLPDPSNSESIEEYFNSITHGLWLQQGIAMLISPFIIYRVIQYMNGQKVSMITSIKYGIRGIIPAAILGVVTGLANMIPTGGGIVGTIITCYWFVCAPAAVVEKLNPIEAISRSAALTQGRRWPIFGMLFLLGLILVAAMMIFIIPAVTSKHLDGLKNMIVAIVVLGCISQLFVSIVQAVSYALLRGDKDGVTHDELAKVFE